MIVRKLPILGILVLLIAMSLPKTSAQSQFSEEIQTAYYFKFGCLAVKVEAQKYVYPEKTANITVRIEAYDASIHINMIDITVYGAKEDYEETLANLITIQNHDLALGTTIENTVSVSVTSNVSPGKILGKAQFEWETKPIGGTSVKYNISPEFTVAYVVDLSYQDLWNKYTTLNGTYNDLNRTYTDLKNQHDAETGTLDNTRRLMGVFAITTAFFLFTTFYLLRKKPAQTW